MMSGGELYNNLLTLEIKNSTESVTCLGAINSLTLGSELILCLRCTSVTAHGSLCPYLQFDASIKAKNESCPMINFVHRNKTHSNLLTLFIFTS